MSRRSKLSRCFCFLFCFVLCFVFCLFGNDLGFVTYWLLEEYKQFTGSGYSKSRMILQNHTINYTSYI